ncbi:hypothetical protein VTJ04DRAFT_10249 [Mycothermus thermophilus]|uniref:uncharacterized protein n=1 Tax=Humicola insolens TaxID=85995 RepID=UPI003742760D
MAEANMPDADSSSMTGPPSADHFTVPEVLAKRLTEDQLGLLASIFAPDKAGSETDEAHKPTFSISKEQDDLLMNALCSAMQEVINKVKKISKKPLTKQELHQARLKFAEKQSKSLLHQEELFLAVTKLLSGTEEVLKNHPELLQTTQESFKVKNELVDAANGSLKGKEELRNQRQELLRKLEDSLLKEIRQMLFMVKKLSEIAQEPESATEQA